MLDINCVKSNFTHALETRCSDKGCELKLFGLKNYIVLKGEDLCQSRRICDCIIFKVHSYIIVGIVELKSKTAHSSEVVEKLTNGSNVALDILEKCSDKHMKFEFYHIVLCKRWTSSEYRVIISRKITVRGKRYNIMLKRCGVSFSEIISGS